MSQSGASPKDSEISTPSPRNEIIITYKNKLNLSNPDVFLMRTLLSKEDKPDINTSTGYVLPKEMSTGQKHFSKKMTKSFDKGKYENKSDNTSEATSSEKDSWKDPLGEISEGSSIEILTKISRSKPNPFLRQKFSFGKFKLPAKELPLPQRVYKNSKANHSNIKYNEKIQSNLVPTVQKKQLHLSAPRELVTELYQEETDEEIYGGSKPVRGKIIHDTDSDEDFYSEALGSSPLKDKVERNDKGKGRAESLDLNIYSLGNEKGAISRPGSRVRYSSPLAKFLTWEVEMTDSSLSASEFANRAPRPHTSFSLWPLIFGESSKKLDHSGAQKQTQVSITPKKGDGKLNNPSSRPHGPSENSSAKKLILINPAQSSSTSMVIDEDRPKLQSVSEAEQQESGAEHSSQSYVTGQSSRQREGIEGEDEEDSPQSEYELETRMRQRKGLRKKTTDKSKRLSKNQRLKKINGELPENVGGMRTVVQVHFPFLLGIQDRDLATIPPPPTLAQAGHEGFVPDGFDTGPSVSRQKKAYKSFVKSKLLKLGLHWFSWDLDSSWTQHNNHAIVSGLMEKYFYHLQFAWRAQQKDEEALAKRHSKICGVVFRKRQQLTLQKKYRDLLASPQMQTRLKKS
ncbi:hypothetical protein BY996DRAFT_6842898 [Phakopsora pachyrhizi]|nr:hypothetical protein BY996DRAFT_6842898 [Phakopsora pachyrhizi]